MREFLKNDRFAEMVGVELLEVECGYAKAREVAAITACPSLK
jgi:hypothetical protein